MIIGSLINRLRSWVSRFSKTEVIEDEADGLISDSIETDLKEMGRRYASRRYSGELVVVTRHSIHYPYHIFLEPKTGIELEMVLILLKYPSITLDLQYKDNYFIGTKHADSLPIGTRVFIKEGLLHNSIGPAILPIDSTMKEWYLDGKKVTAMDVFEQLSEDDKAEAIWHLDEWK